MGCFTFGQKTPNNVFKNYNIEREECQMISNVEYQYATVVPSSQEDREFLTQKVFSYFNSYDGKTQLGYYLSVVPGDHPAQVEMILRDMHTPKGVELQDLFQERMPHKEGELEYVRFFVNLTPEQEERYQKSGLNPQKREAKDELSESSAFSD
jgi:hypothetical protein